MIYRWNQADSSPIPRTRVVAFDEIRARFPHRRPQSRPRSARPLSIVVAITSAAAMRGAPGPPRFSRDRGRAPRRAKTHAAARANRVARLSSQPEPTSPSRQHR